MEENPLKPSRGSYLVYVLVSLFIVSSIVAIATLISRNFDRAPVATEQLVEPLPVTEDHQDQLLSLTSELEEELSTIIEEEGSNEDLVSADI